MTDKALRLALLGRALRSEGVGTTLRDELDAAEALRVVDEEDKNEVCMALRIALKIPRAHFEVFDRLFGMPLRVIADSHWRTPAHAHTLGLPGKVLIAGREDVEIPAALKNSAAELLALPMESGRVDLQALMRALSERAVNELHVEAGATLAGALLEKKLVDEVLIYQAPILLGNATRGAFSIGPFESMDQRVSMQWIETVHTGPDLRLRLKPCYGNFDV